MDKILIFGNSGSGKSTLARELCSSKGKAHLDLDTLAWQPVSPPVRLPVAASAKIIECFINRNPGGWVIEGCYTDLLEIASTRATEIIFMNVAVETCVANARNRPWEPHKYESRQAQDANLDMLIDWIGKYETRDDTFSLSAHENFYQTFAGKKKMILSNDTRVSSH